MQQLIDFAVDNPALAGSLLTCGSGLAGLVLGKYIDLDIDKRRQRREAPRCNLTSLYAKVVRWEVAAEGVEPLYTADATRAAASPLSVGVFDETVYTSVAVYDKPTEGHEYTFRGGGVVDLMCMYPWRDRLRFPDKGAAADPHQVRQAFSDQSSNSYVIVTHAYNGLQIGNEDFAVRMPVDSAEGRLVVDLSSVPHVMQAMTVPPRAELRSACGADQPRPQVFEYRRGIYTIVAKDLRKDDVLFLDFTVDWDKLCQHSRSTS
ncbi:MAG: hypothetical protein AAF589_06860 [Planctomycetota bacterium]